MKLEILSLRDSINFIPEVKTYPIRISSEWEMFAHLKKLKKNDNWLRSGDNSWYLFDDRWSKNYKEYSWVDINGKEFQKYLENEQKDYPKMTKESLMGYIEARGHIQGRETLFSCDLARKLYVDFEEYKNEVEQVMIHCERGKNRSPAIGIAMNETYGWGIEGLKEKFPSYRRFVYDIMKEVGEEFG